MGFCELGSHTPSPSPFPTLSLFLPDPKHILNRELSGHAIPPTRGDPAKHTPQPSTRASTPILLVLDKTFFVHHGKVLIPVSMEICKFKKLSGEMHMLTERLQ